jgi:hypothetical protein
LIFSTAALALPGPAVGEQETVALQRLGVEGLAAELVALGRVAL